MNFNLIVCLLQSESHVMKGLIPEKHQRAAFDTIIQTALDSVVNEGEVGIDFSFSVINFEISSFTYNTVHSA